MIHDPNNFLTAGKPLHEAGKVMVLVHGRGGSASDILTIADYINDPDFAFIAPQATDNSWYPYSFMKPVTDNEPYLSAGLTVLTMIRARLQADYNLNASQLYWLGFSQGACLTLEFIARNPLAYGGVFGLSGGLIGPKGTIHTYAGDLGETPVFLGCSDIDPHIPKGRVLETETILRDMGATVLAKLYHNFPHSINEDELSIVNSMITATSV